MNRIFTNVQTHASRVITNNAGMTFLILMSMLIFSSCIKSQNDGLLAEVNEKKITILDVKKFTGKEIGDIGFDEAKKIINELVTFELLYQASLDLQHSSDVTSSAVKSLLNQEFGNITMDDKELAFQFDQNKGTLEKAEARHILISFEKDETEEKVKEKRKLAKQLWKRAKSGEDFAMLARQYSVDPGSKNNGGYLGAFSRGQMVKEFDEATFALKKPNDISPVVETQFGFHIIQLINRSASLKGNEEVYREKFLRQKKNFLYNDFINKLKKNAIIDVNYELIR